MTMFSPFTLTTARLALRFLRDEDAAALYPIYSDTEAMAYWSTAPWTDPAQAAAFVADTLANYDKGTALCLAITLAETGELVGVCKLYAFSRQNRRCDIGYMLGRAHWGKGYMQEALPALIRHAFGPLELRRIEADIDPRNSGSARLLERLHFRHEGHMRERWIVDGQVCDTDFYGLLRSDWEAAHLA